MKKIDVVEIEGEKVYLRKSFLGWKVVYPIKIEGKTNWKNLIAGGNWWNLLKIAVLVAMILIVVSEYSTAVRVGNECINQLNSMKIIL
jgi:hypothetical protein